MSIQQERKKMGFTQQELSTYLGVNRTDLTKTERGKRVIPHRSLSKWLKLKRCLEDEAGLKQATSQVLEQQHARLRDFMNHERCLIANNISVLEYRLNRMEATYQACIQGLAFVAQLREQYEVNQQEEELLGAAHLEARATKKIRSCGLDKQAALFMKLKTLKQMEREMAAFDTVFFNPK